MTNNNNQVNWDEIPEDVEAVVTYLSIPTPNYYKTMYGKLMCQRYRHGEYEIVNGTLDDLKYNHGYQFHLRPSPITQPTPVTPESTQVENSGVEDTTTPEFDWSSVDDDVEAVCISPEGELYAQYKYIEDELYWARPSWEMYKKSKFTSLMSVAYQPNGDGILIRRPPATTPPDNIGLNAEHDLYKKVAAEVDTLDVSSIQTETYTPKPPSISTILQEAQQSILKHHGVTGKVKFTVTCSE